MTDEFYGHFHRCVDLIHGPCHAVNYRDVILPLLSVNLDRSFLRSGSSYELELTGEGIDRINAINHDRTEKEGISCMIDTEEVALKGGSLRPVEYVRS